MAIDFTQVPTAGINLPTQEDAASAASPLVDPAQAQTSAPSALQINAQTQQIADNKNVQDPSPDTQTNMTPLEKNQQAKDPNTPEALGQDTKQIPNPGSQTLSDSAQKLENELSSGAQNLEDEAKQSGTSDSNLPEKTESAGSMNLSSATTKLQYESEYQELATNQSNQAQYGPGAWEQIKSFGVKLYQGTGIPGFGRGVLEGAINTEQGIGDAVAWAEKNAPLLDPLSIINNHFNPDAQKHMWDVIGKTNDQIMNEAKGYLQEHITVEPTLANQIGETLGQFAVGFLGAGKLQAGLGAINEAPNMLGNMTKWGLAQYLGFDEHHENLVDMAKNIPALSNIIPSYLTHNEGDNPFEARLKNAVDGIATGALNQVVTAGIQAVWKMAPMGWVKDAETELGARPAHALDVADSMADQYNLSEGDKNIFTTAIKDAYGFNTKSPGELPVVAPAAVGKSAYEATRDGLFYFMQSSLLSGLVTNGLHLAGTTSALAVDTGSLLMQRGITMAAKLINPEFSGIEQGEIMARLSGMGQGVMNGLGNAWKYLETGEQQITGSTIYGPRTAPTFAKAIGKDPNELGVGMKYLGYALDLPGKSLGALNEFMQSIAYQGQISQSTFYKAAVQEGLSGEALAARKNELLEQLPLKIQKEAIDKAQNMTFVQDLGPFAERLRSTLFYYPETRFLDPFFHITSNITKFNYDIVPGLNLMFRNNRTALESGGRDALDYFGKTSMGAAMMTGIYSLYNTGHLTGSEPLDYGQQNALKESGWQPHSLKIGNTYVPLDRIAGLGGVLHTVLDGIQAIEAGSEHAKQGDYVGMFGSTIAHTAYGLATLMKDNPWAKGFSQIMDLVNLPPNEKSIDKILTRFGTNEADMFIPAAMKNFALSQEDYMKDARGAIDKLKAGIPGLAEGLPDKYSTFGDPIPNKREGLNAINPFAPTQDMGGGKYTFYQKFAENNLSIEPAGYSQSFNGVKMNLNEHPEVLNEVLKRSATLDNYAYPYLGDKLHDYLQGLVDGKSQDSKDFLSSPKEAQEKTVAAALNSYRSLARKDIMDDPKFRDFQTAVEAQAASKQTITDAVHSLVKGK